MKETIELLELYYMGMVIQYNFIQQLFHEVDQYEETKADIEEIGSRIVSLKKTIIYLKKVELQNNLN